MKWPFSTKRRASNSPVRAANLKLLGDHGFVVAPSLPERGKEDAAVLRPIEEIAGRLAVLNAIFAYVAAPESAFPAAKILGHLKKADLLGHLTPDEEGILGMNRNAAAEKHGNAIGWKTENSVALAWVLGRGEPLALDGSMLDGDQIRPLVSTWPPIDGDAYSAWMRALKPRPIAEVAAMEDLFCCAHNAARSAQVEMMEARGKPVRYSTVPEGFDAVANGGVFHERRHALTWAVSPGVAWDETDLNT